MPRIVPYDAGNLALRPTETGVEAEAAAGRRLGGFYNQVGGARQQLGQDEQLLARETKEVGRETADLGAAKGRALVAMGRGLGTGIAAAGEAAVNWQTHREVSAGAKSFADFNLAKTNEWNDTVKGADPNDPTIAPAFRAGLEDDFEKLKGSFVTEKGQAWADAHIAQLRQHFNTKTAADMSTLAGQAVAQNHRETVNSLSAAVHADPSGLDNALGLLEGSTTGMVASSPNLTGTAAADAHGKLLQGGREALVKSAAIGFINQTGQVPEWISDPKYAPYVNAAELKQFQKQAEAQQKSNLYYQRATDTYNRQQAQERATTAVNKVWTDNVTVDEGTGRPTIKPNFFKDLIKAVQDNPNAPNAAQLGRTYMNWGEAQLRARPGAAQSDPTVKQGLVDRMMDAERPTTAVDLMEAQVNGKLSNQDFAAMHRLVTQLEKEPLRDPVFKDTMHGAKSLLGTDPIGQGKYASFVQDFLPRYQAAKRSGSLEPNALDLKNPESMISKAMKPYQRSGEQILRDKLMRGDAGATPAARPDIGTIKDGFRFKGGDPSKPESWERVQ